ncbi:hypothetical protein ACQKJZ_15375 [Sphingomonas sp. NPDC019816]|uniref:hypothetical protein n=1 Tax=Sphingomonas sp. NPDC019816 TaxID=3390679 RepID=UPI003D077A92
MFEKMKKAARHPGKMPNALKLIDCIRELQTVFRMTPITDNDRETPAYLGMLGISPPSSPYHDRSKYAEQAYLTQIATEAIRYGLSNGTLPVWCDYNAEWVELDHDVMFARNKWERGCVLGSGVYRPLNVRREHGDEQRLACEDATLWVREQDWPKARSIFIADREKRMGSVLRQDWQQHLQTLKDHIAGIRPLRASAASGKIAPEAPSTSTAWNEAEMTDAIRAWTSANSSHDRDRAWKEHFKPMHAVHGWSNRAFRDHWTVALKSTGRPGPRGKSAQ